MDNSKGCRLNDKMNEMCKLDIIIFTWNFITDLWDKSLSELIFCMSRFYLRFDYSTKGHRAIKLAWNRNSNQIKTGTLIRQYQSNSSSWCSNKTLKGISFTEVKIVLSYRAEQSSLDRINGTISNSSNKILTTQLKITSTTLKIKLFCEKLTGNRN